MVTGNLRYTIDGVFRCIDTSKNIGCLPRSLVFEGEDGVMGSNFDEAGLESGRFKRGKNGFFEGLMVGWRDRLVIWDLVFGGQRLVVGEGN